MPKLVGRERPSAYSADTTSKCRIAAGRDRLSVRRAEVNSRRPSQVDVRRDTRDSHARYVDSIWTSAMN